MKYNLNKKIIKNLKKVIDPEIGINIVDLGFIYNIYVDKNKNAIIEMTLTIPGCPLAGPITQDVILNLKKIKELKKIEVKLVFNPPWSNQMVDKKALNF